MWNGLDSTKEHMYCSGFQNELARRGINTLMVDCPGSGEALRLQGLTARIDSTETSENPKGRLQEKVQPIHGNSALRYEVTAIIGEDHARIYEVAVYLHQQLIGRGSGSSKKIAEAEAAREALVTLDSTRMLEGHASS